MPALPRAECPQCGRSVPVRRNGALREHRVLAAAVSSSQLGGDMRPKTHLPLCEGSGRRPEEARP